MTNRPGALPNHCADCGEVALTHKEALHELWSIISKVPYRDLYAAIGTERVENVMGRVRAVINDAE